METTQNKVRRSKVGEVISHHTEKTIKVEVEGIVQHPRYKKHIKRQTQFMVHDPKEEAKPGDTVRIEECRPVSKSKKWVLREVIKLADAKAMDDVKETGDD